METDRAWHDWVFEAIVNGAPEAIVAADAGGVIRLWNPGAESMFGYSAADAVGETLDLIIPERFRDVTERWQRERDLRQRLVELEAGRGNG